MSQNFQETKSIQKGKHKHYVIGCAVSLGLLAFATGIYLEWPHHKSAEMQRITGGKAEFWEQYKGIEDDGDNDSCAILPEAGSGNLTAAIPKIKSLAEAGNRVAQCQLGLAYMKGIGGLAKNPKEGMKYWLKAAEAGDAQAQFSLGMIYDYGKKDLDLPPNAKKAFYWYGKSAAQGNYKAEFNFASQEEASHSAALRQKGVELFKKLSDQGEPWADFRLGRFYQGSALKAKNAETKEEDFKKAVFYLQKGSDGGNAGAMYILGKMYLKGNGVPVDLQKGIKLLKAAADKNDPDAQRTLAKSYLKGEGVPQDFEKGIALLIKAADQKDGISAAALADLYHHGKGVPQDEAKAVHYWQIALDQGIGQAREKLIEAYQDGIGVSKDQEMVQKLVKEGLERENPRIEESYGEALLEDADSPEAEAEAAQWIKKAAEHGDINAIEKLEDLYRRGQGLPKDFSEAEKWQKKGDKILKKEAKTGAVWALKDLAAESLSNKPKQAAKDYRKAAQQGDSEAQYLLGVLYLKGQGVKANPRMAVAWWKKAAEQHHLPALLALGGIYLPTTLPEERKTGKEVEKSAGSVKKNIKTAIKYYKQAADLGNAEAQNIMGYFYFEGKGVRKDPKQAVKYWEQAAEQGNGSAQIALSLAYQAGQGVKQDKEKADYWRQKAASDGKTVA